MPSKSKAQHNYMAMMAFNPPKGKKGPSRKVAKEFVDADKRKGKGKKRM